MMETSREISWQRNVQALSPDLAAALGEVPISAPHIDYVSRLAHDPRIVPLLRMPLARSPVMLIQ